MNGLFAYISRMRENKVEGILEYFGFRKAHRLLFMINCRQDSA